MKEKSRNIQLPIKSSLMVSNKLFSKLRMFWSKLSKLCKSNWNWAWNLAFPVFAPPHLLYGICVKIFTIMNRVYFKELRNEQKYYWPTIHRARAGAAVVSTITSINIVTDSFHSHHHHHHHHCHRYYYHHHNHHYHKKENTFLTFKVFSFYVPRFKSTFAA